MVVPVKMVLTIQSIMTVGLIWKTANTLMRSEPRAISIIADKNKYHPIQEKLKSLMWDGKKRIENALPHFLGVEKNEYTCAAMQLFMLGAIHRIFRPGCKFEIMLCLVGGQGAGKSTFFRFLAIKDE